MFETTLDTSISIVRFSWPLFSSAGDSTSVRIPRYIIEKNQSPVHEESHCLACRYWLIVRDGAGVRVLVVALDHSLFINMNNKTRHEYLRTLRSRHHDMWFVLQISLVPKTAIISYSDTPCFVQVSWIFSSWYLGAEDFHPLVVSVRRLPAVVDSHHNPIGESEHCKAGVDVSRLPDGGVDLK